MDLHSWTASIAAVCLGSAALLTACGEQTDTAADQNLDAASSSAGAQSAIGSPPSAEANAEPSVSPGQVVKALGETMLDYTPVKSSRELVGLADVVVTATIESVRVGRIYGGESMDAPLVIRNTALEVTVDSVHKGDVTRGQTLWIELPARPERADDGLLPGLQIAAYLAPARGDTVGAPMGTAGSQVPPDAKLWGLAHPEGLVVQYRSSEGTVEPYSGEVDRDETVEEAVPAG